MSDDMRVTIAAIVADVLRRSGLCTSTRITETTSGCPLVEVRIQSQVYNLTITKSRKP